MADTVCFAVARSVVPDSAGASCADMADTFVAAIDQGTTSSRCLLFDHAGRMVSMAQLEHQHHYPQPGWVEHDAVEVWRNVTRLVPARRAAGRHRRRAGGHARHRQPARDHGGVGPEHRRTGRPRDHLAGHPYRRLRQAAQAGADRGAVPRRQRARARVVLRGTTPALAARPHPRPPRRAKNGQALFGTMETWLIWNLTGGPDGGCPRHRRDQREPHHADGPRHLPVGRPAGGRPRHPAGDAARDPRQRRGVRHLPHGAPRGQHRRRARGPAGRAGRTDLLRPRRGQVHVRHRAPSCCSTPAPRS